MRYNHNYYRGGGLNLRFWGGALLFALYTVAPAVAANRPDAILCNQFWFGSSRFYKGMSEKEGQAAQLASCNAIIGDSNQTVANRALAFFNRGKLYNKLGRDNNRRSDFEQSVADFTAVIRLDPNDAEAYMERASAYTFLNRYDLVIADETEAIRLKPTESHYSSRAANYKTMGDYARALQDATEAVRRSDKYSRASNATSRASIYKEMGDFENALKDYDDAIKFSPKDYSKYYERADLYREHGDFDRAMQDYNYAVRLEPKYALPYIYRGDAYFAISDYDRAIADYGAAIRVDPKYVLSYRNRAKVHLVKNDRARAIADYDQAIRLDDDKNFAYHARGIAYFYLGEFPRALIDLQAAYDSTGDLTSTIRLDYALWVEIARRRIGQPSRLAQMAAEAGTKEWPEPIAQMLLGEITYESALAAANMAKAADGKARECSLKFFWGERLIVDGGKDDAIVLFRNILNECKRGTSESLAAKAELKSLDVTP